MSFNAHPPRFADLHLHTRFSDGTLAPRELVEHAARLGFSAIAVTDHDTLDGIPDALAAAKELGIEVIPGVEITSRYKAQELHMLAYLFGDSWRDPDLRAVLQHAARIREERIEEFVKKLNGLGIGLTIEDVRACSECGTVGRMHVAMALLKRGYVTSTDEAFTRFLKRGKPAYVERYRMETAETIGYVTRAGGVAVIAHPGLNTLDEHLGEMVNQGMAGIEVWHARHTPAQIDRYLRMAEKLGVCATGGSDCHGFGREGMLLGRIKLPYKRVEALKQRAKHGAGAAHRGGPSGQVQGHEPTNE
ncbi:MAG: PHP domain-containing protein [Verrucomicrobiia bacterium]|jgi:predicted metal-dependent phosphoesterase TrpH